MPKILMSIGSRERVRVTSPGDWTEQDLDQRVESPLFRQWIKDFPEDLICWGVEFDFHAASLGSPNGMTFDVVVSDRQGVELSDRCILEPENPASPIIRTRIGNKAFVEVQGPNSGWSRTRIKGRVESDLFKRWVVQFPSGIECRAVQFTGGENISALMRIERLTFEADLFHPQSGSESTVPFVLI